MNFLSAVKILYPGPIFLRRLFGDVVTLVCALALFLALFPGMLTGAQANTAQPILRNCAEAKTTLTTLSLLTPTNFIPIIPTVCSVDPNNNNAANALSLDAIPVIIVRVYGLLASTTFFLAGFNLIFVSVRYSYGAFSEGESSKALSSVQESAVSIFLVLTAHLIISTLFSTIFKIPLETDASVIGSYFN